jgi:hypothetical protein
LAILEIFCYCVGQDESKVKKTKNPFLGKRLKSKIGVLKKMQEWSIWLLDASIVGLYNSQIKKQPMMVNRIIQTSWHEYVEKMVLDYVLDTL